jgi:hypothetical protein
MPSLLSLFLYSRCKASLWYLDIKGKNIKIIPNNIAELLTARALAYWLASNGHYALRDALGLGTMPSLRTGGCVNISTESFTLAMVNQLRGSPIG